jgi:hypothetical protein
LVLLRSFKCRLTLSTHCRKIFEEKGMRINYMVGTILKFPRAAVTADEVATAAEFFYWN